MNLGTHNSWSFAKPVRWYIPHFTAKCQSVDIKEQFRLGARMFDLRLRQVDGVWVVAHGSCVFDVDFHKDLEWLNEQEGVYIRMLLEYNKAPKDAKRVVFEYRIECNMLMGLYPNLTFVEGRSKWDWNFVFEFPTSTPPLVELYSSVTTLFPSKNKLLKVLDDWCPWIYAKLKNKQIYEDFCNEGSTNKFLLMDFINMVRE